MANSATVINSQGVDFAVKDSSARIQILDNRNADKYTKEAFQRTFVSYGNILPLYIRRVEGKRCNNADGRLVLTDDANSVCYIMPVKPSTGYYMTFARYAICLRDDMVTTTGPMTENVSGVNTTDISYYLAFSFNSITYPESTYYFFEENNGHTNSDCEITVNALRLVSNQQTYLSSNIYQDAWELGDIRTDNGQNASSSTSMRTKEYCPAYYDTYVVQVDSMAREATIGYLYQYADDYNYCGSGSVVTIQNGVPFTTVSNVKFVRIALSSAYGTTFKNDIYLYQPGGIVRNVMALLAAKRKENSRIIVVSKFGDGDYTSLRHAVIHAQSGDTIFVRRGVYENEEVEAWEKDLTIVGESPYNTIISNETDAYATPPLEMSAGALYNLTFHAIAHESAKKAYALHIDNDYQEGRTFYAENCIFISDDGPAAVGAGSRINARQVYKNCIFENKTNQPAFFGNEATDQQTAGVVNNQYYQFYNCTFKTPSAHDNVVIMRGMKAEGNTVWCTCVDCAFMDDGTTDHPVFRMDYTNAQYIGTATEMGDMGLVNWNLDPISSGNTIPALNRCKEGVISYFGPIGG